MYPMSGPRHTGRFRLLAIIALAFVPLVGAACMSWNMADRDAGGDGDADADADGDTDGDGDADADDGDHDADADAGADADADADGGGGCDPLLDVAIAAALREAGCPGVDSATFDLIVAPGGPAEEVTWELSLSTNCSPSSEDC